jgi:predicted DNA-binding transcriptional regulator YafY
MRYEKAENLLSLALEMQVARGGISLGDIQEKFEVTRRTAMRMRDAVLRIFPQADEVVTDERTKRWRIPAGTLDRLVDVTADELADLETAASVLRRDNMGDQATTLENLLAKLMAVMKPDVARKVEPDLEALLEAENLAMRPGPKPKTRTFVLEELRDAVKACRVVTIQHRTRKTRKISQRKVHPYGFLYGHRHYLVACQLLRGKEGFRLFSLPNIEKVLPTEEYFERDAGFSLEEYSRRSFGVFHEEPVEAVWKFSPRAAPDARDFVFHPDQTTEDLEDGSLIARFRAGGKLEMCWHLYMWGADVKVLKPQDLAEMCEGFQRPWPGLP